MMAFGLVSTLFDLMTFYVLLEIFHATEPLFQSTWFLVSVLTEIAVVLVLRTHLPCWRSRPSPLLLTATIAVGMLAVLLPYLPPTANAFSFVPIPLPLLLTSHSSCWPMLRRPRSPSACSTDTPLRGRQL